jgi:hypothetical protein
MKKLFYSLVIVLFYSCTTTFSLQHAKTDLLPAKIEKDKIIGIVTIDDAASNGKVYTGSGLFVLNSLRQR